MSEEKYDPTAEDLTISAGLKTVKVMSAIQQAYADGKIGLETYNQLFQVAREADGAVRQVVWKFEKEHQS